MTFGEYESVVLEATACYERAGYELAYGPRLTAYGYYHVEYVPKPGLELGQFGDKEPCRALLQPTQAIWSKAKSEPGKIPQTVFDDAHTILWTCMKEAGVDLRGNPPGLDAARAIISGRRPEEMSALKKCQDRVFDEVGLPNWIA